MRWAYLLLTWAGCVDLVYFGQRQAAQLGLDAPWVRPACWVLSFAIFAVTRTVKTVKAPELRDQIRRRAAS